MNARHQLNVTDYESLFSALKNKCLVAANGLIEPELYHYEATLVKTVILRRVQKSLNNIENIILDGVPLVCSHRAS